MILNIYDDAARRYSDETCFIFEMYLLVDHSKMLVFIKVFQKVFLVLYEVNHSLFLSQRRSSLVKMALPHNATK